MKSNTLIFVLGFVIAFAGGYFIFSSSGVTNATTENQKSQLENASEDEVQEKEEASEDAVPIDAEPLSSNNCLSCHAVDSLNAKGGTTGPDLSTIYKEIEGKHGNDLDSFLQAPSSAVMSSVLGDNPLSDEDREAIVKALKKAAEK